MGEKRRAGAFLLSRANYKLSLITEHKKAFVIWDLFQRDDYQQGVEQGLIRTQKHPDLPLWIHNYTNAALFTKHAWDNPAVRICRGLISDVSDRIVAQPFAKFFNYNQPEAGQLDLHHETLVLDKIDGSLGVLFPTGRDTFSAGLRVPEYAVATRGSFASEQAITGTKIWREKYQESFTPDPGWTYLFEIVYPGNRIVLDYEDTEDLFFLGAHRCGWVGFGFVPPDAAPGAKWWPGPKAQTLGFQTLQQAIEAAPRKNAEGVVVLFGNKKLVKIKQQDYLELHRLITGLRPKAIWEYLAVNACKHLIEKPKMWETRLRLYSKRAEEILDQGPDWRKDFEEKCPDEWGDWLSRTIDGLESEVVELRASVRCSAEHFKSISPDRRTYFENIKNHQYFGLLGLEYDSKDITLGLWEETKPSGDGRAFVEQSEDTA